MVPQGRREVTVRHLEQLQFRARDRLPAALAERSARSWVGGWQVGVYRRGGSMVQARSRAHSHALQLPSAGSGAGRPVSGPADAQRSHLSG